MPVRPNVFLEKIMLLSTIVKAYKDVRVLCIGDVMLDHFLYGKVERISPEAPVPVFNYRSEKSMLGGAGNVVANLTTLGCRAEVAQLVEQGTENPRVGSSILSLGTTEFQPCRKTGLFRYALPGGGSPPALLCPGALLF